MKLEKRKVNVLTRQLENFKRERLNEELKLDDKVIIEVPIIMGSQLKDTMYNKGLEAKVYEENQKQIDEYKKDENAIKENAKKSMKDFVSHLEEAFKDLYLKEKNKHTVNCKGRKELRSLIEQCKENNIKYKWEKLVEGDYKYNVKFSLKEDWEDEVASEEVIVQDTPIQEPTTQPEAINLDNLKLGDAIVVTQNLLDALMQTKASVEQMADTITNATEPITPNNEQEVFPVEQEVEIEDDNDDLEIKDEETFEENLKKEVLDETKLNEEKYSDEEFEIIENALYDAGLEPSRFNDMGILTKNLGWVVNANGKTIYLSCDGTWLDENKKQEQPKQKVNEALQVLGSLEDYSPSPSAKPLYDLIVSEGMLDELDKVLREIYQDGASIEELNNLLSTEKDFVKSMLGLDEMETSDDLDKEIEDETIEEIEKEDALPASEKEPEPKDEYLNDETGYGLDDEEDDLSNLEDIVDSKEAEEM